MAALQPARKLRGAWYTPPDLVELVVEHTIDTAVVQLAARERRPVRVLDPACGDGRFLIAAASRIEALGGHCELVGCDVDADAIGEVRRHRPITAVHADALAYDWAGTQSPFDVVVGNPPFLSQMAAATTRGGASRHGGGPYADAAVEFLALAHAVVSPDGGRFGLVLPQSILAARDAGGVRDRITSTSDRIWSWWSPERIFDAQVRVCAVAFERTSRTTTNESRSSWTAVITDAIGIPAIHDSTLRVDGTIGDRAHLNANFRDEYYGMVPAVIDRGQGPPLITSGLIDPGRCLWGERPVRFAKRQLQAPTVELERLDAKMRAWASRKLVPKVLVANQTRIIEAIVDHAGAWLPGVPVTAIVPNAPGAASTAGSTANVWAIAAVLNSPVASALAWHELAGTGLSATSIRLGPRILGALAWPAAPLDDAIAALRRDDIVACGVAVTSAYGLTAERADELVDWWSRALPPKR